MAVFVILLYNIRPTLNKNTEYVEVVKVVADGILPGEKIANENLTTDQLPADVVKDQGYITKIEDVINKYANDRLYKNQYIRAENIKGGEEVVEEKVVDPGIREVRIITDVAAYGGVGKGDKVDLIFVNKIGAIDTVGKILYEGLEVTSVLNKSGVNLEKISADKYNTADLEPGFVTFEVSQEKALEIETLQGTGNDIVFKLTRFIEGSDKTNTLPGIKTEESIIYNNNSATDKPEPEVQTITLPHSSTTTESAVQTNTVQEVGGAN